MCVFFACSLREHKRRTPRYSSAASDVYKGKGRDAEVAKRHARIVEESPFIWIAHDVGPRAMSAKVKGVVQPRSWFIDIAPMSID